MKVIIRKLDGDTKEALDGAALQIRSVEGRRAQSISYRREFQEKIQKERVHLCSMRPIPARTVFMKQWRLMDMRERKAIVNLP